MTGRCQLQALPEMAAAPGRLALAGNFCRRLQRFAKRRYRYLLNYLREQVATDAAVGGEAAAASGSLAPLLAGDTVRVRSMDEIRRTLDRWNSSGGCAFMPEMAPYCGTTQRVRKRLDRFLDERDYRVKRCRNVYLLEEVICDGTEDFGGCDRSCFFFWKREWLEKVG